MNGSPSDLPSISQFRTSPSRSGGSSVAPIRGSDQASVRPAAIRTSGAVCSSSGVSFDVDGKTRRLTELEHAMADGALWSDQERARRTVEEVKAIKRQLDPYHALAKRVGDGRELSELVEAEALAGLAAGELGARARDAVIQVFGQGSSWVWKDPRLCLLAPFWRAALGDDGLQAVVVVRGVLNPRELGHRLQLPGKYVRVNVRVKDSAGQTLHQVLLQVHLQRLHHLQRMGREEEAQVVHIVSEALANVAKHSQATQARVIVRCDGPWLVIEVADDRMHVDAGILECDLFSNERAIVDYLLQAPISHW